MVVFARLAPDLEELRIEELNPLLAFLGKERGCCLLLLKGGGHSTVGGDPSPMKAPAQLEQLETVSGILMVLRVRGTDLLD